MRQNTLVLTFVVLAVGLTVAPRAHAGGFEWPGAGAIPMGRGGAFTARSDDPLALQYNPAGLAQVGGAQLLVNASLAIESACIDRSGSADAHFNNTGDDVTRFGTIPATTGTPGTYLAEPYRQVCNSGPPGPGLEIAATIPITDRITLGFGILTPIAVGGLKYGNDGVVGTGANARPSAVRYMLADQNVALLYPTVGLGAFITDWLRAGLTFSWGLGNFQFTNYVVATTGENPETDMRSKLSASDWFIPQLNFSLHLVPVDGFDAVVGFRWSDSVRASGTGDLTWGQYGINAPNSTVTETTHLSNVRLTVPQPWVLYTGFRYSSRYAPRRHDNRGVEGRADSLADERWDVELDANYEINSNVDAYQIAFPAPRPGLRNDEYGADGSVITNSPVLIPSAVTAPKHWKNQLSLRLGGDYNIIRGVLAARLGVSFETRGLDTAYTGIDFLPFMRLGLHVGVTWRVGRFDLTAAYMHFFQETITVPEGPQYNNSCSDASRSPGAGNANLRQINATGSDGFGCVVNAGKYMSSLDAFSIGMNYHF